MVSFHLTYTGALRCEAVHDPSGTRIVTDAPTDNHGRGQNFSPTDLLATSLGVCILTTIGIAIRNENFVIDGSQAYVEKHMSTDPPRRVQRIVVRIDFAPGIPPERRAFVEHIARTCPVARSLNPEIVADLEFVYPDKV